MIKSHKAEFGRSAQSSLKIFSRNEVGEIVVLATRKAELMGFRDGAVVGKAISGTAPSTARRTSLVEVMVGPNTQALNGMIGRLHWRQHYGV